VMDAAPAELTVECTSVSVEPRPDVRLVLVQALAKGDRDELAIETATELGIDAVIPWQSERSIVRWKGDRAAKAHGKWQSTVAAAAKQARRAWIPEVRPAVDTQALAKAVAEASLAVILHEDAVTPLRRVLGKWSEERQEAAGTGGEILLIVGPEGGISPREVTRLCSAGAVTALLGPHVLRSSTAGPAGVVVASDVLGRW
jgi:16S rRNA (uracil1498-N3)-methyltransferase